MTRHGRRGDEAQPDLAGGDDDDAQHDRFAAALLCLRDAVAAALEAVATLNPERDSRSPRSNGAYTICSAGLRAEHHDQWWTQPQHRGEPYGWNRTSAQLVTWEELRSTLLHDDPRRAEVITWTDTLTDPDQWRDLLRPYDLYPEPGRWHLGYLAADHDRPGWDRRLQAWHLFQDILTTAHTQLPAPTGPLEAPPRALPALARA